MITELARGPLQTVYGDWTHILFWDGQNQAIAHVFGAVEAEESLPVRVHSSCITAHVFLSTECDCREQLDLSFRYIQDYGRGVVIWLDQEGRSNGMMAHVASQHLKRNGLTQSAAYEQLGYPADARRYESAAQILYYLGVKSIRVLTNNPLKVDALREAGLPLVTDRQSVMIRPNNALLMKQYHDKIEDGHFIPDPSNR